jgi:hypothetical protein
MRYRRAYLGVVAAFAAAGCSSEAGAILTPGESNAGLAIKIVAIVRDSSGYAIRFQTTNQDKAVIGYSPDCDWRVDMLGAGGWTALAQAGTCDLVEIGLTPGASITTSVHVQTAQALTSGTMLRVELGWNINQESTSDPTSVN